MQARGLGGRRGQGGCLPGRAQARLLAAAAEAAAAAGASWARRARTSPVAIRGHIRRFCATTGENHARSRFSSRCCAGYPASWKSRDTGNYGLARASHSATLHGGMCRV
jgi:hypothetical protein